MRLEEVLDQALALLEHPEFKTYGGLQKHIFQTTKPEEDRIIRSERLKGTIGNSDAVRRGHLTRKKKKSYADDQKRIAKKRAEWYKDPRNMEKFKKRLKKRLYKARQQA